MNKIEKAFRGFEMTNEDLAVKQCRDIVEKFAVSFSVFCAENYSSDYFGSKKWFCNKTGRDFTTEGLFKIWENEI